VKHWYRDFFNEHALDVWQQSRSEDLTAAEVDFLASALDLSGSGSLLDLASGNGRHAAELAARGYALTCVDIAEGNRARIEARAAAAGASVVIVIGDLTEIELAPSRYGGAYLWGNSLGYFPAAETAAFFARVAAALAPGARFAVESAVVAECILGDLSRRTWFEIADDMQVMLASSYEPRESRLDTIYTSVRDGVVVDRSTAHVWVFTCREVIAMAAAAGLALVDLCGGLDGAPFELGDDQLIAVFEKL
jgi:SAM-dependent methyltransferase